MEKKIRILVVDDEPHVTRLSKRVLEEAGYTVATANDGRLALDMLAEEKADLVLLDIMMPGLDGYEVLKRIRQRSDVPVLIVSALRQLPAAAHGFDLGADDYIEKPFLSGELVARVKAKLRRSQT